MFKIITAALILSGLATAPATAGLYANTGDTSAYAHDWAQGSQFTNYAFLAADSSFVGSWTVDQGPDWETSPTAYSGLTAAALLFGGSAGDYFISTVGNAAATADHLAWVSTYGGACSGNFPCGTQVAEGFVRSTGGTVPEPTTWGLMIGGFALTGVAMRRRKTLLAA